MTAMKTLITSHRSLLTILRSRSAFILIALALGAFGLSPAVQAVNPPPDGGYAGGNTAEGQNALLNLTTGGFNTAVGFLSLRSNTTGAFNTAIGAGTLLANTADNSTATGAGALLSNTTGTNNTANGTFALFSNTTGTENAAYGANALLNSTTGGGNTAVGFSALPNNTTGVTNTALGFNAGFNVTTADNVIVIGTNVGGENVDHSCFIGEIFGQTSSGGTAVFINSNGKLGTTTSSRRFKEGIKPMEQASETLFALKPVTFRYKKEIDPAGTPQFGLVAEDVEKVNPDLVVRDKDAKAYSVRYEAVNAMLLNEFLKEHRKIEEQSREILGQRATITELKKGMAPVVAQLKEQAAQIQKVSAQLETNKFATGRIRRGGPAPQVVNNP
jgi:Chaperone of endosialidase